MKTKKKALILSLRNLLMLSLSIIMLSAITNPMSSVGNRNSYDKHDTPKYRPILDSSIVCSWYESWPAEYELEFFYIVEQMPKPKIPLYRIENILEKEVRFNTQERSYNGIIGFQCVVNCNGKAGDYQILRCPDEFVNISCQVLNILREKLTEWEPPIQGGKNVDILALIAVKINKGQFEIMAPVY